MPTLHFFVVFVGILSTAVPAVSNEANTISMSDLITRVEMMESRYQSNIQQLNEKVDETVKSSALEIAKLKAEIAELSSLQKFQTPYDASNDSKQRKRALDNSLNIAFTAYLDHDTESRVNESILFNKVLLNDGNAYNNLTGEFTVPVTGVYHFDFFIGERNVNQVFVILAVNNNTNTVDGLAQSVQKAHDVQGGNSANLMVRQGDTVIVRHLYRFRPGSHIEGSDKVRISTFSGFLLYVVEEEPIIIG